MPTPALVPTPSAEELDALLTASPSAETAPESGKKSERIANAIVLAILFAAPALMCVHAAIAYDNDIWWHLRTGEWILQHHAIPHTDPFSWTNAGKPWPAYSWLFEVLVVKLFQRFGLAGIVGYSATMLLAITVAMRHLVHRLQADFTVVVGLTFAACYSLGHMYTPRPWLFTILFFVLEVDILMNARKTGRMRELAWLPLIFALWSNIHIQFIDGLLVLGLALAEPIAARMKIGEKTQMRVAPLAVAFAGSIAATLLNPFGWRIYRIAYELASQAGVMDKINELAAIPFRDSGDYCVLFLALGSAAALAWRRRFCFFELGLRCLRPSSPSARSATYG